MLSPFGGEIERGLPPRGLSSGCDDLTIFEQPEFFNNLRASAAPWAISRFNFPVK